MLDPKEFEPKLEKWFKEWYRWWSEYQMFKKNK